MATRTDKVERFLNLVICLLSTRQFLSADRIRASVAGYDRDGSDEAFSRMFERDKNELRDLGVPLETGPVSRTSAVEGYRIDRTAYELADIDLTSEEAAAVAVAVRLWDSPELVSAAQSAVTKLRSVGVQVEADTSAESMTALASRVRGAEPTLDTLIGAIDAGRRVTFDHRSSPAAPLRTRTVEPWGVVTANGRWYLVGHDVDRDAPRTFRLSRIVGDVTPTGARGAVHRPDGVDLRAIVREATASAEPATAPARVWVADERAHELRRLGTAAGEQVLRGRTGTVLAIPARSLGWLARTIAGYGTDAVALDPPELQNAVVEELRGALAAPGGEVIAR
ncbi:YafY family transcriptional regulator [Rhodococcus rhodnii]|uniref:YafY family transcriptional regulator n=2 Tax=Rhodococcus rhodnii TaxID=38312 RepID=A0A6P2CEN4_9NOCA|nr:YafY family protein [Rhodococcus rhodnii]EOM78371.1 putative transcriptional regulator [Rhodococcus rhodnii LMG 5362]TXG91199.1 YafY family transcriptional regulator [Rhodococcus rhodnii]